MTDMPKRITAWTDSDGNDRWDDGVLIPDNMEAEYIRADIPQAQLTAAKAEIERLRSIIAAQTEGDDETPEGYGRDPHTMEEGE